MNKLSGNITSISSEGQLSLVKINVSGSLFTSILIDTPATASYLVTGNKVFVVFKENEVVIAKDFSGQISMQNKFEGTIQSVEAGKLLCSLSLYCSGFSIVSIITAQAAAQMNLVQGDQVTALIKTNEISLSPHD
jgi:molybdopterin-binding protein